MGDTLSIGEIEAVVVIRDAFTATLEKAKEAIASIGPLGSKIAMGIGVVAVAVAAAAASVLYLGQRGSDIDGIATNFKRLTEDVGGSALILKIMRDGVKGTVEDTILMTRAVQLLSTDVKMSAADFDTLTKAAIVLNDRGFGSTKAILEQLSDSLVSGRVKSVQMMLGTIDTTKAEVAFAQSLGITSDQLSETGKVEAKRLEILSRLRQAVDEAGDSEMSFGMIVQNIRAQVTNFVDALSVAIATSPALSEALGSIAEWMKEAFGENQVGLVRTLVEWVNEGALAFMSLATIVVTWGEAAMTVFDMVYAGALYVANGVDAIVLSFNYLRLGMTLLAESAMIGPKLKDMWNPFKNDIESINASIDKSLISINDRGKALDNLDERQIKLQASSEGLVAQINAVRESMSKRAAAGVTDEAIINGVAAATANLNGKTNENVDVTKEQEDAIRKAREALKEIDSSGRTWQATVATLDLQMVSQIKRYLEAGVSQSDLAAAYSLTAVQVKAVASALEAEHKSMDTSAKLWAEHAALVAKNSGTARDAAIADIRQWAADTTTEMKRAGADTQAFYTALEAVSREKTKAIGSHWDEIVEHSKEALDAIAVAAEADYQRMLNSSLTFSQAAIQHQKEIAQAARDAAKNWRDSFVEAADAVKDKAQETAKAVVEAQQSMTISNDIQALTRTELDRLKNGGTSWSPKGDDAVWAKLKELELREGNYQIKSADDYFNMNRELVLLAQLRMWAAGKERPPGFAGGVDNFGGGWAVVGEKGPEVLNLPWGSDIIPNDKIGGGSHVTVMAPITIAGSVLGDHEQLADVIGEKLKRKLELAGYRATTQQ